MSKFQNVFGCMQNLSKATSHLVSGASDLGKDFAEEKEQLLLIEKALVDLRIKIYLKSEKIDD